MKIRIETIGDVAVLRLEGLVGSAAGGDLQDTLVALIRSGRGKVLVELDDGVELSRAGVRSLVVAATVMRAARRPFRIVAGPRIAATLRHVSFRSLLTVDPDRETALAALSATFATDIEIPPQPLSRAATTPAALPPAHRPILLQTL